MTPPHTTAIDLAATVQDAANSASVMIQRGMPLASSVASMGVAAQAPEEALAV